MRRLSIWMTVNLLLLALGACRSNGGGTPAAKTEPATVKAGPGAKETELTPPSSEQESPAVGKFASVKLAELEARARRAGWEVLSSSSENKGQSVELELGDKSHYAYVTLIDLSTKAKGSTHVVRMGRQSALVVECHSDDDEGSSDRSRSAGLLGTILKKSPLDGLSRDRLTAVLKELRWSVDSTSSDSEDGVTLVTLEATKSDQEAEVMFYDLSLAKKEGRLAIDGNRFINVFVCRDCTKRKVNLLSAAWQNAKAKRLLGELTHAG